MMEFDEAPKKTVLCYGDSNTWGRVPGSTEDRFPSNIRWPGVLSKLLRTEYRIIEEGLSGRTTTIDDTLAPPGVIRNGARTLGAVLYSHAPLDLVVIMLGTNDLKRRFSYTAADIAKGVGLLAAMARNPECGPRPSAPPTVLAVCPPSIWEVESNFGAEFRGGRERSQELRPAFQAMAERTGTEILYAEDFVQSDPADGIHLSAESHAVIGQEVAKWILAQATAK